MIKNGEYFFLDQKRVIFGQEAGKAAAAEAERRNASRVLVVSSRSINRRLGATESLREQLGERLIDVYDEIEPHAPLDSILELRRTLASEKPDLIVSIGGGSVIDTVKVATLADAADAQSTDEIAALRVAMNEHGEQVAPFTPDAILRQVAIPTTLSGAEFGTIGGAVDTQRNIKDIYTHPQMCSDSIIYDAELCRLTPNELWIATAMRAVDHAVETILSLGATPFTDGPALHALRLFGQSLQAGDQKTMSLEAIQNCQFAVWAATIGLMRAPYGASHGIGHQVGAVAGVQHGICSCAMLPSVLRYNAEISGERDAWIAEALGAPQSSAADAVLALIRRLGLPDSLKAAGAKKDQFEQMAKAALPSYFVRNNPRPITDASQIMDILEMAWET
ncbi:NAD-dependent methanol dehydrogenase [Zhongshania aliphaticivorans]|uniref:NAD-dependent methanol dehydrogenase n=1 Tax=Zhongshania aliphaticivorans TaxID=1470434 RepID=A0A5S9NRT1_9GAMM|nr:iron-containing alcohol dehydrogenase [Zhongshania aliphaticivorans]CAA0093226.1 NAD-dependent methanol dehydrogenase [Zhongshania aliphaticivorans]CAA0110997.1 NAD-dependent methanol dehydrogenase [Zhongshania aliphaticivorans]